MKFLVEVKNTIAGARFLWYSRGQSFDIGKAYNIHEHHSRKRLALDQITEKRLDRCLLILASCVSSGTDAPPLKEQLQLLAPKDVYWRTLPLILPKSKKGVLWYAYASSSSDATY